MELVRYDRRAGERMTAAVGIDVESICSKCGDVWHVVVAKVGDRIVRVQCKECGREHRPKAAEGVSAGGSQSKVPSTRKRSVARTSPVNDAVPSIAADLSRPVRSYGSAETFTVADRISHPSFGAGVVEAIPGPGKIQVFFPGGRRILAQAKATSGLARPPASRDAEAT